MCALVSICGSGALDHFKLKLMRGDGHIMDKKDLPIIPSQRGDDLHHLEIADSADLILFMAGNQFMAMKEIVTVFQEKHPDVEKFFTKPFLRGLNSNRFYPAALCLKINF